MSAFATRWSEYAGGRRAPVGALTDEALERRLRAYKRQVAKRYRVIDPDQIGRQLTQGPYQVSTKLDGELWFLVKRAGQVALSAFNGRVLVGTPLVREAEAALAGAPDLIIAGELTARPLEGERSRVHHVATSLGEARLEKALGFAAFDLVEEDGEDQLLAPYADRLARLRALFEGGDRVAVVHTEEVAGGKEVEQRFRDWVLTDRYEGLVVRSERGFTYKIKRSLTLDAVVLAYGERLTGELHQMREMSLGLLREDGSYQLLGPVGTGFREEDRVAWVERLSALEVPSTFRLANREGTLSKFVRPEIVVEVRCSDLLAVDSWDAPIRRMSLAYEEGAGWRPTAERPTAVMIHPIFLREREDKPVDVGTVGLDQLTRHVPLPDPTAAEETAAEERADPREAEVLERQVFVKETKGKVAVRKYALIRTRKAHDGDWPPFVTFFTDFSPGRKEPLQTALKSASRREVARQHVEAWLLDSVKRGWGEVEAQRLGDVVEPPAPVQAILEAARAKAERETKTTARAKRPRRKKSEDGTP